MIEWRSGCCGSSFIQINSRQTFKIEDVPPHFNCKKCRKPCDLLMYEDGVRKNYPFIEVTVNNEIYSHIVNGDLLTVEGSTYKVHKKDAK